MFKFNEIQHYQDEVIALRRHLHQYPELSNVEFETLAFIKKYLSECGIEPIVVQGAGVIGIISNGNSDKTVLLRADIDALEIVESLVNGCQIKKETVSKNEGVMHACGHDAHTAMLLVASKILVKNISKIEGRVIVLFEQGEEASNNVSKFFDYFNEHDLKIDSCFAIHTSPFHKTGKLQVQSGPLMAGNLVFHIKLIGQGGHGSRPDLLVNPIGCFNAIYTQFETLRMRFVDPFKPFTASIAYVKSGSQMNAVMDELEFGGTARFFDVKEATVFKEEFEKMVHTLGELYTCKVEYVYFSNLGLPVINDEKCIKILKEALEELSEDIIEESVWMSTESFADYIDQTTGCLMFLSTNNEDKGITSDLHNCHHDIDESVLIKGVYAHLNYAISYLKCVK